MSQASTASHSSATVGSSSSSADVVAAHGVGSSTKDGGTCSYYAPMSDGCSTPRPCFDCLNFNVAAETLGCMVNAVGKCVSVTGNYAAALDFRTGRAANANTSTNGTATTNGALVFRASDAQYCNATDTACAKCRTDVFAKASSRPNALTSTTFCFGEGGCVCIAACESTRWSELVGGTQCPSTFNGATKPPMDGEKPGMSPWEITLVAIAVLLAVLIAVILFKRRREDQMPGWVQKVIKKFSKPPATSEPVTATTTAVTGTTEGSGSGSSEENDTGGPKREGLSLFGWRVMREELIDNENHRLARVDEDRSPAAGFVQFADTAPSAPSFDDDMDHNNGKASAPPSAPDL